MRLSWRRNDRQQSKLRTGKLNTFYAHCLGNVHTTNKEINVLEESNTEVRIQWLHGQSNGKDRADYL